MLVCPLYAWKFDLQTGRAVAGQCALETDPVRLGRSGQVLVELGGKLATE